MAAAVADVSLLERELTPALVRRHLQAIRNAPVLLVDGNLQPPAIAVQPLPILATSAGGSLMNTAMFTALRFSSHKAVGDPAGGV